MDRSGKARKLTIAHEREGHSDTKLNQCSVCRKRFKSRSHFDAICDICWADSEMRPYLSAGAFRRAGVVN